MSPIEIVTLTVLGIFSILAFFQPLTAAQKDCPTDSTAPKSTTPPTDADLKVAMIQAVNRKKAVLWPGQKYAMAFDGGGVVQGQTFGGFETYRNDDIERMNGGDRVFNTMNDVIKLMAACKGWHKRSVNGGVEKRVLNCDYCWDEFAKIKGTMTAKGDSRFHNCKDIAKALFVDESYCH